MGKATHSRITAKRAVKIMMSVGIRRNQARLICLIVNQSPEIKTKTAWRSLFFHPDFLELEGWLWDGK